MTTETKDDHGLNNAKAWLGSIMEMVAEYEKVVEDDDDGAREKAEERIQESALSVEVRSGWYLPGGPAETASEYRILLTTGGPALQLVGELSEYGEAETAELQHQDWGTPWTELRPTTGDERKALLTFAQRFYFAG